MIDFYKYVSKISNKNKFKFGAIILISLFIFKKINVKLNNILGITIGFLICLYLFSYDLNIKNSDIQIYEKKKNKLAINDDNNRIELINILFELRDLKQLDKRNFNFFMISIKKFLDLDIDFNNLINSNAKLFYLKNNIVLLNDYKNKGLNYLLSMTLSINNKNVLNKIEKALEKLNNIMNCFIEERKNIISIKNNIILDFDIKPFNYKI